MSWFHPHIGRGRSMYTIPGPVSQATLQTVSFSTLSSSVGECVTSHPDEFGCEEVVHHIVVETAPLLATMYATWLDDTVSAGEVVAQWKRTVFEDVTSIPSYSEAYRHSLVHDFVEEAVYVDTVNDVLSDMSHVYFTNNCLKQTSTKVLVKASALGGYRLYNSKETDMRFCPASLGTLCDFYSWDRMTPLPFVAWKTSTVCRPKKV
jgi:hypothetical protein